MNSTNNFSARESYQVAKRMFYDSFRPNFPLGPAGDEACWKFVYSMKLSQSDIRLECGLSANATSFTFGVNPQQNSSSGAPFNTEIRLPMQDSICVNEWFLYFAKPSSSTDAAFKLHTYGNFADFTANAAAAIDGMYSNGKMKVTVNNDVLVPGRLLSNFIYRPETQQTAALGAGSPNDQWRGAEDGGITSEPNLILIGSKNNVISVEIPAALATVDANSRIILVGKGIYAQNSTIVN